jgi:hypothetical protein
MSVLLLAALVAGLAFVAIMIFRPAAIVGVKADALSHSLLGEVGRADLDGSCIEPADDEWRCAIKRDDGSLEATYRIETHDYGCWDAKRIAGRRGSGIAEEASACINILDYIRVF